MTRIFLVRKSTPYFAVIFNILNIISRFCDKSLRKKREGEGKMLSFVEFRTYAIYHSLRLQLLWLMKRLQLKYSSQFTVGTDIYLKMLGLDIKVYGFSTSNFRSQEKQYIYLLSYYVSQEWLHFSQSKGHAKICYLRGNKMPAVFKDSNSIPCLNCNCDMRRVSQSWHVG